MRLLTKIQATIIVGIILLISQVNATAGKDQRLLRFPTMNATQVVFSYAGDLYTVSRGGGLARRLTSHIGTEIFPRFSPDGTQIAFTGQYDGNTEVYLIPAAGGNPKRLTITATLGRDDLADRMGPNNIVMTWRDDKSIVYRSRKQSFNDFKGQLFVASTRGGLSEELPFSVGGFCSYSPDRKQLAMNHIFREFRTWKYYQGGMADDIYIHDLVTGQAENITNNPAQDICPMWYQDNIYFISDRNRTMNLFVYNIKDKSTRKLTNFNDYDIKFPSLGPDGIVFEQAGALHIFSFQTQSVTRLEIELLTDINTARNERVDAAHNINGYEISPDGQRIVFNARGEIWTVPAKKGVTRQLTSSSASHERNAHWSPDGQWVAFISDATGEDEIYFMPTDGSNPPTQLTRNSANYKFNLSWSPDSKKILWSDKNFGLYYIDIEDKNPVEIARSKTWEISSYRWSPDSRWVAYVDAPHRDQTQIFLYNLKSKNTTAVTDKWYDSANPVFSDDGKYLYFTSNRDFNPIYSWTEWNTAYVDMSKIYLVTLDPVTPSPFKPENDEVLTETDRKAKQKDKDKEKEADKDRKKKLEIDFEGIDQRIISLPIKAGNYWNIYPVGTKVYYMASFYNAGKAKAMVYDLETKKETELGTPDNFQVSFDGKKMLVAEGGKYSVIDLPNAKYELKEFVDLTNLKLTVNKAEEWKQIYTEAWRQMRDFFYAPNMHGVNWKAIHDKYAMLLPYCGHRNDVSYLIGEMIGELNCGHAYVGGGDRPVVPRVNLGLLGATLIRDSASGYYQITDILEGANWSADLRSPLREMGVGIRNGTYIIAVNGRPTNTMNDINAALIGTAGQQVELTVSEEAASDNVRKVNVIPLADESNLRYYNWVRRNIRKVDEATNGEVGYIHIPDMGTEGLNEFVKHFYPQLSKKALIIDVRGNGGGNVSPMLIERLRRELDMILMARNSLPTTSPSEMMLGPKIALLDQYTASDGDLFSYRFKKYNLGLTIGRRSWGGTVGIRGTLPFVDGGNLFKPEFSRYDPETLEWIIEGYGVKPDIEVFNNPADEYRGKDDQLNRAIEEIKRQLKEKQRIIPPIPPYPDKSR